jgi:1-acyl-sn-glycerol-3-phosphate acyltransferase
VIATTLAAISRLISGAKGHWHCEPGAAHPRIYYANHSSHLDFIVIWSALPAGIRHLVRPVAGEDYWLANRVRRYLANHIFHAVLVERAQPDASDALVRARAATERMANALGGRHSLILFPEGTRARDGEVGAFKSGLYYLSQSRPDVELIPVYLENLNRILPKGEVLPVPMLSRVVFGPPLTTIANECRDGFLARAREALLRLRAMR